MEAHSPGIQGAYDSAKQAVRLETDRPAALREAILELLGDDGRRRGLGVAARRRVEERGLFWDENARRIEEQLELLERGPRPASAPLEPVGASR
jgi:glycosyltransferase involved in cell wall biosynthesis